MEIDFKLTSFDDFILQVFCYDFRDLKEMQLGIEFLKKYGETYLGEEKFTEVIGMINQVKFNSDLLCKNLKKLNERIGICPIAIIIEYWYKYFLFISCKTEITEHKIIEHLKTVPNHKCTYSSREHLVHCRELLSERNKFIFEEFINSSDDFIGEKTLMFNRELFNFDTYEFRPVFSRCLDNYKIINKMTELIYDYFLNITTKQNYETLNLAQKRNFHNRIVQLLSYDLKSYKDSVVIRKNLCNSVKYIGLFNYCKLMKILNMIGWYGTVKYFHEFENITKEEKIWLNNIKEKHTFKYHATQIFERLFISKGLITIDNKIDIWKNLHQLGRFILVSNYSKLICTFHGKPIFDEYGNEILKSFTQFFQDVVDFTESSMFTYLDEP